MPVLAVSAKYTPEALAAVRKAGYASREPAIKSMIEQFDGKFLAVYWPLSPDWDFVALAELPSTDDAFAIQSFGDATGAFLRSQYTELRTSAEADAAIARQVDWTRPGS